MSKNVNELETMLKEQVEAGLITDFELKKNYGPSNRWGIS